MPPTADEPERLRVDRERLDAILEAAAITAWDWDPDTGVVLHTRDYVGNTTSPVEDRDAFFKLMHADDRARVATAFEAAYRDGSPYRQEFRLFRPDGSMHWIASAGRAVTGSDGRRRMAGVMGDVTQRKQAEEHRNLLINELNHRVKNTLATVQAIAAQTFRNAGSPAVEAFERRLLALSAAHNLLTRESWEGAPLREVAAGALAPFRPTGEEGAIRIDGPDLRLGPKSAVALATAINELGENAAQHGALSASGGRVAFVWSTDDDRLRLRWSESGGPVVAAPTRRGFGLRMLEQGLPAELGGAAELDFRREGMVYTLDAPLPAVTDAANG